MDSKGEAPTELLEKLRQQVLGCVVADFVQRHFSTREVHISQTDTVLVYYSIRSQIFPEFPVGYTISAALFSWNFKFWNSAKLSTLFSPMSEIVTLHGLEAT